VYVYVFTSISVLQNSLYNTTSLTALDILQLLQLLLFNSSHFCALLLHRSSEAVRLGNPWQIFYCIFL